MEGPVLEPGPSLACAIPSASSGRRKARGRCALTQLQRTDCIPRTASHCWALQREQNTPVHMWPFFQLNVKSPPVGGLLIGSRARARFAFFSRPRCPRYAPARRPPAGRAARRGHAGRPPEHIRAPLPGMPPGPPTRTPTPAPLELVCAKLAPLASGQTRASFHHSCAAILAHSRPVSDRHPQPPPFSASQSTTPPPLWP